MSNPFKSPLQMIHHKDEIPPINMPAFRQGMAVANLEERKKISAIVAEAFDDSKYLDVLRFRLFVKLNEHLSPDIADMKDVCRIIKAKPYMVTLIETSIAETVWEEAKGLCLRLNARYSKLLMEDYIL